MAIRILTDSTSDISPAEARQMGIDLVPLKVIIDGRIYTEGVDIQIDEFYPKLAEARALPTTSQPAPEQFLTYFERAREQGDELIVLLISSRLSGTVDSARIAKDICGYEKITIIDSLNAIVSLRLLVEYGLKLIEQGKSSGEIVARLEECKSRIVLLAMVDTLKYLHKGGRLSATGAMVGSLLHIKPLITLKDGEMAVMGKVRGVKSAMQRIIDEIAQRGRPNQSMPLYFGYTYIKDTCLTFAEEVEKKYKTISRKICPIGCVIGTHVGPGGFVLAYLPEK
ncbi:MAG: DegV family protein [Eubacteriales bacterium]|nr:DegV family protein [Eubacteriales bacterium]